MQKTFHRQSAYAILRTARVEQTRAGQWVVVVYVPHLGDCHANILGREGSSDALRLRTCLRHDIVLTLSPRGHALLSGLLEDAAARQGASNY